MSLLRHPSAPGLSRAPVIGCCSEGFQCNIRKGETPMLHPLTPSKQCGGGRFHCLLSIAIHAEEGGCPAFCSPLNMSYV